MAFSVHTVKHNLELSKQNTFGKAEVKIKHYNSHYIRLLCSLSPVLMSSAWLLFDHLQQLAI